MAQIKESTGKGSSYTIKMKSRTCRLIEGCGLHVCVKCVDVERHSGAAGFGSPREAHERNVSCWQIPTNKRMLRVDTHINNKHNISKHPYTSASLFVAGKITASDG